MRFCKSSAVVLYSPESSCNAGMGDEQNIALFKIARFGQAEML